MQNSIIKWKKTEQMHQEEKKGEYISNQKENKYMSELNIIQQYRYVWLKINSFQKTEYYPLGPQHTSHTTVTVNTHKNLFHLPKPTWYW